MIINIDGYGKILQTKSAVKDSFKKTFNNSRYYYDEFLKGDTGVEFNYSLMDLEDDWFIKDIRTGICKKTNHDDLPSLINSERDKKNLLFTDIGEGFYKINDPSFLYGEFSMIVYDVFLYLRGLFPKDYSVIIVKPNNSEKEISLSDNTYWGVSSFEGNFLFSSNIRDNIPTSYKNQCKGYGIKFLIRDPYGNELEVGKVDTVYNIYEQLEGIHFELDIDSLTAAKLMKSKTLYGSKFYTDEVKEFSLGDFYKEKMIDALSGLIGIYLTEKDLEDENSNFIRIYLDVVASICIIRNIPEDDLREILASMLEGISRTNNELIEHLTNLILSKEEMLIQEAENKNYYQDKKRKTLHDIAVAEIQKREHKRALVRSIKKPQD